MNKSKKSLLEEKLQAYLPFIEAVVELFQPFVEIAVHDLLEGKLIAVYHNISQRKVGDATPINELKVEINQFPDYFSPYVKRNWDGRNLKCTSITIRDEKRTPIGLVCINVDTTFFAETKKIMETFLKIAPEAESPIECFGGNYQDLITQLIEEYLSENKLHIRHLKRDQKKELVHHLYHRGAFNYKNAPPFISDYLKICRATVYNYLKELGSKP